jgi:hypothetical protein
MARSASIAALTNAEIEIADAYKVWVDQASGEITTGEHYANHITWAPRWASDIEQDLEAAGMPLNERLRVLIAAKERGLADPFVTEAIDTARATAAERRLSWLRSQKEAQERLEAMIERNKAAYMGIQRLVSYLVRSRPSASAFTQRCRHVVEPVDGPSQMTLPFPRLCGNLADR